MANKAYDSIRSMKNNIDLTQALNDTKKVLNDTSWFRDTPHYWASASLPFAYAMACVEVVSKMSEKAGVIYQRIIEAWANPCLKAFSGIVISEVSGSELEKVKNAILHPEIELLPDPNKAFLELEKRLTGFEVNEEYFEDTDNKRSPEVRQGIEEYEKLAYLIMEFIIIGFNREPDVEKGRYRVLPSQKAPWLILAVVIKTVFENYNLTLERLRDYYKLRTYKGKTIDFHKVLTEQTMSRWHRRMIASGKAAKLKLKNDRIVVEAARHWYQCRVIYPSINKYLDSEDGIRNIKLDLKNIQKQIYPCDEAVGYQRRLKRNSDS